MSYKLSYLAPCFYHEGIYLLFLARVVEDAVLSDSAHSGGADAVVPVALHRSWVRLDSEALVRWSSEIQQDLIWWWAHERLELVSSLGWGFSPVHLWSDSSLKVPLVTFFFSFLSSEILELWLKKTKYL